MGNFLAATALRDVSIPDVLAAIEAWFEDRFVVSSSAEAGAEISDMDRLTVYEPVNDWVTVLWPMFFGPHQVEMAKYLSERLNAVVSSVDIYHSETWQHVVYDGGVLVDAYGTDPSYLASDLDDPRAVARYWKGNPQAVAGTLGGPVRVISRIYRRNRRRWTFDDWAFVEVWEACGIVYPVGEVPAAATVVLPERWEQQLGPAQS